MNENDLFSSLNFLFCFSKITGPSYFSIKHKSNRRILSANKKNIIHFIIQIIIYISTFCAAFYQRVTDKENNTFKLQYIPEYITYFSYLVLIGTIFFKQLKYKNLIADFYNQIVTILLYYKLFRIRFNYKRIEIYSYFLIIIKVFSMCFYLIFYAKFYPKFIIILGLFLADMVYVTSETQMTILLIIINQIATNLNKLMESKGKKVMQPEIFSSFLDTCVSYHYNICQLFSDIVKIHDYILIRAFIGFCSLVYVAFRIANNINTSSVLWTIDALVWLFYNIFGICVIMYMSTVNKQQVCIV